MDKVNNLYVDPYTKKPLRFVENVMFKNKIVNKALVSDLGDIFQIENNIPDFRKNIEEYSWHTYYESNANTYDLYNDTTFKLHGFDEYTVRRSCADKLGDIKNKNVLEIGCGTGRDSIILEELMQGEGNLFLLDLSESMLGICQSKLKQNSLNKHFVLADAMFLPFCDNYFDALYSFVTLPAISNLALFLNEIIRVCKPCAKIVLCCEGLLPSLKKATFGRIIIDNCDLYNNYVPLEILPNLVCDVKVEWIVNGIFHILQFSKLEKENEVMDIEIPGKRGGTLYTRYYGKIEGVSLETKDLIKKAMKKSKKTNFDFLNEAIISAANKELEKK